MVFYHLGPVLKMWGFKNKTWKAFNLPLLFSFFSFLVVEYKSQELIALPKHKSQVTHAAIS